MDTSRKPREEPPGEEGASPSLEDTLSEDSPARPGERDPLHPWRSKNPLDSFRHAGEGIAGAFRTQRNLRFHFLVLALVLVSGLFFRLDRIQMLVLLLAAVLVLLAEMFNTAIEVVVDMITLSYHPSARYAKDVAAGAVLLASLNAVVVGIFLFLGDPNLQQLRLRLPSPPLVSTVIFALLLLLVCLSAGTLLKKSGTSLPGGVPSYHTAIAFFLATTIIFVVGNVLASILALLLATLVAQSRVEARFHTVQEVILGAALGLLLTACAYQLPEWLGPIWPGTAPAASAETGQPEPLSALQRR